MKKYRLDKTTFKIHTVEEAASNYTYWKTQSLNERLRAAMYLNSVAYNYDIDSPPRMDKTAFKKRKRS